MLPIVVGIVVIGVRGVGQSVNWRGGVVIGQGIFGGGVIFVGVMVAFAGVNQIIVVGIERGGERGVGWVIGWWTRQRVF